MPTRALTKALAARLEELLRAGRLKGSEAVICGFIAAGDNRGPRYLLEGEGEAPFLRMNSNNYLGMALRSEVIAVEEAAAASYGVGPGAVRFISGTWSSHVALERRLAAFHARPAAMLFSSAYAAIMGIIPPLVTDKTAVISDELNHNCIINAVALARPAEKHIYKHLDMGELERRLETAAKSCARAIMVTDGVFSMRGDHAPLDRIMALARGYDSAFAEGAIVVVDDSHGVGAFGPSGRGSEEFTGSPQADLLVATLGKAFGVNGGYVVAEEIVIRYLRETSPFYIYSNPITPAEAAAARLDAAAQKVHQLQLAPAGDLTKLNLALRQTENALITTAGLPNRPWYRHTIYAPGVLTGYAAVVIPGVNEAIDARDHNLAAQQLTVLTQAIDRAAAVLSAAP